MSCCVHLNADDVAWIVIAASSNQISIVVLSDFASEFIQGVCKK